MIAETTPKPRLEWGSYVIVGLVLLYLLAIFMPAGDPTEGFNFAAFGRLPVQEEGRIKPLDTYARTKITVLSIPIMNIGQSYVDDDQRKPATEWLLQVLTTNFRNDKLAKDVESRKVCLIDDPEFAKELGLPERQPPVYAEYEFQKNLFALVPEIGRVLKAREEPKNARDKRLADLARPASRLLQKIDLLPTLAKLNQRILRIDNPEVRKRLGLEDRKGSRYAVSEMLENLDVFEMDARNLREKPPKKRTLDEGKILETYQHIGSIVQLAHLRNFFVIPPLEKRAADWQDLVEAAQQDEREGPHGGGENVFAARFTEILKAYSINDSKAFNSAVTEYRREFERKYPDTVGRLALETYFNRVTPFFHLFFLSTAVFVMCCLSWVGAFPTFNKAALWSMAIIAAVATWGLVVRMYLQGRPPVTTLYSSAIFIGWGCTWMAIVAEIFYRRSFALAVGAICSALSLLVANYLGMSGDTLETLQAVLDTNFWLATHVTTIVLGYASTFVAGFIGICFVFFGMYTKLLSKEGIRELSRVLYGIICFSMFLSFTGTVLGGIWADQSWGRFWGWDPKENGALLLVLWNALILHARWGGMAKARGIALLAILGNCVTAWSWFGTNFLGVGLHSYGFMQGAMFWLLAFVGSQLAIVAVGLTPTRYWRSYQNMSAGAANGSGGTSGPPATLAAQKPEMASV